MERCSLCSGSLANDGLCPTCPPGLPERVSALAAGAFPATSLPPPGVMDPALATQLRVALLEDRLEEAEALWAQALAGMRPIGPEGRRQLAHSLQAAAALAQRRGQADSARRLLQRAETALKDPLDLKRKQSGAIQESKGWDQSTWVRLQADEAKGAHSIDKAKVLAELAQLEAAAERRLRLWRASGLAVVSGITGSLFGLPGLLTGLLGAGLGWAWPRRT